jgi:hypothetical protein
MDGDCACGTGMTDLPVLFPGRRFKKLRIQMIDDIHCRLVAIGHCLPEKERGFDLPIDEPQESTEQVRRQVFQLPARQP